MTALAKLHDAMTRNVVAWAIGSAKHANTWSQARRSCELP